MLLRLCFCASVLFGSALEAQSTGEVIQARKISSTVGGLPSLADEDLFGYAVCSLGDLDGDSVVDLAVGLPGFDGLGTNRGAVWILFLQADGTVKATQKIDEAQGGFTGGLEDRAGFGRSLCLLGDLSGDGSPELAVGAPAPGDGSGRVYLLSLSTSGTVLRQTVIAGGVNGFPAGLYDASDPFGDSVARIGDLDFDGAIDIAIGRKFRNGFGYVFVLRLRRDGTVRSLWRIGTSEGGFSSTSAESSFGRSLAEIGDLDRDGVLDLLVGDSEGPPCDPCPGAYWILFLKPDGSVKSEINVRAYEPVLGGFGGVGMGVVRLGDVDGDGVPDALVGAPNRGYSVGDPRVPTNYRPETGAAMVVFLQPDGTARASAQISAVVGGLSMPLSTYDHFGFATAALGDFDGDGKADAVVSAPSDDDGGSNRGALYLLSLQGAVHPSSASVFNGSHRNRLCFANAGPPAVGALWPATVDASGHAGATTAGYVLSTARATSSVLVFGGEELLVQLGAQRVGSITQPTSGGVDTFLSPIPNDVSLFGIHVFTQGFLFGGGIELCNALELVVQN